MAAPTHTIDSIGNYKELNSGNSDSLEFEQVGDEDDSIQRRREILNEMSNAQRMKRGLPLRKPGHLFNSRLGARQAAPSEARQAPAVQRVKQRDSL